MKKKKKRKKKVRTLKAKGVMYQGSCLKIMREIPSESVHCVVTSPPYWGLRDYDVKGQHGIEPSLEQWLDKMEKVFRQVRRILRPDGTCWVNIGDNYVKGELTGQPWELAFRMKSDGWILRSDCIWAKPNPTPEPGTRRRPTLAHEYIFQFVKTKDYYYDGEAIKEPQTGNAHPRGSKLSPPFEAAGIGHEGFAAKTPYQGDLGGRGKRTIWTITSGGAGDEGHFAAFPDELPEICIKASTSERGCCIVCGAPMERVMELTELGKKILGKSWHDHKDDMIRGQRKTPPAVSGPLRKTVGWKRTCDHDGFEAAPCNVFDPYAGRGTTGVVALRLGRNFTGIELKPEWYDLARKNLTEGASQAGVVTDEDLQTRSELGLMSDLERALFDV